MLHASRSPDKPPEPGMPVHKLGYLFRVGSCQLLPFSRIRWGEHLPQAPFNSETRLDEVVGR